MYGGGENGEASGKAYVQKKWGNSTLRPTMGVLDRLELLEKRADSDKGQTAFFSAPTSSSCPWQKELMHWEIIVMADGKARVGGW